MEYGHYEQFYYGGKIINCTILIVTDKVNVWLCGQNLLESQRTAGVGYEIVKANAYSRNNI